MKLNFTEWTFCLRTGPLTACSFLSSQRIQEKETEQAKLTEVYDCILARPVCTAAPLCILLRILGLQKLFSQNQSCSSGLVHIIVAVFSQPSAETDLVFRFGLIPVAGV